MPFRRIRKSLGRSFRAIARREGIGKTTAYYLKQGGTSAFELLASRILLIEIYQLLGRLERLYPFLQGTSANDTDPSVCPVAPDFASLQGQSCSSSGPSSTDAWNEAYSLFFALAPYVMGILMLQLTKNMVKRRLEDSMAASLTRHSAHIPMETLHYDSARPEKTILGAGARNEPVELIQLLQSSAELANEIVQSLGEAVYGAWRLIHYASPLRVPGVSWTLPDPSFFVVAYCFLHSAVLEPLTSYCAKKEKMESQAWERVKKLRQDTLAHMPSIVGSNAEASLGNQTEDFYSKQFEAFQAHSLSRHWLQSVQATTQVIFASLQTIVAVIKLYQGHLMAAQIYDLNEQLRNIANFFGFSAKHINVINRCAKLSRDVETWDQQLAEVNTKLPKAVIHETILHKNRLLVLKDGFCMVRPNGESCTLKASSNIALCRGSFVRVVGAEDGEVNSFLMALLKKPHPMHALREILQRKRSTILSITQKTYVPPVGPTSLQTKERLDQLWKTFGLLNTDSIDTLHDNPLEKMNDGDKQKIALIGAILRYEQLSEQEKQLKIVLLDRVWSAMNNNILPAVQEECRKVFASSLVLVAEKKTQQTDRLYTHTLTLKPDKFAFEELGPSHLSPKNTQASKVAATALKRKKS